MGKSLNRHSTEKEAHMADKQMQRCSVELVIREMQIKKHKTPMCRHPFQLKKKSKKKEFKI